MAFEPSLKLSEEIFISEEPVTLKINQKILQAFDKNFSIVVLDEKNLHGTSKVRLLWDGHPIQIVTPLLSTSFGVVDFVVKGKGEGEYKKYFITCDIPNPATNGPITPDEDIIDPNDLFYMFMEKVDNYVLEWGKKNFTKMYSDEEIRELQNSFQTISKMYSSVIRKSKKDGYNDNIKFNIPVTKKRIKLENGVFIQTETGIENAVNFGPSSLLDIVPGSKIKTVVKFIDVWRNFKNWGTSLHTTDQLLIKFPPKKKCMFSEYEDDPRTFGL